MEMDEKAAAEWQRGKQEASAIAQVHQRLRDAVVEAVRSYYGYKAASGASWDNVRVAFRAMEAFEREHDLR